MARDAFRKLPDDEQQVMAVPAFCEGLCDRGVAAFVATLARNSAARAVRIAEEGIAVNCKKIESKLRSKSSKKALLGEPQKNAAGNDYSSEGQALKGESEYSRSPVQPDSGDEDCLVGAPGRDSRRRGKANLRRNPRGRGGRRSATYPTKQDSKVQWYRCQEGGHMSNVCPNRPPARDRTRKDCLTWPHPSGLPGDSCTAFRR